jgi:hypothetical protein
MSEVKSIEQQLADLKVENAKLKETAARKSTMSLKVSEKGALSVYGNGRFPTTLYAQQWERLLEPAMVAQIVGFIKENSGKLARKE